MNYFEELNKFWRMGVTSYLTPNASLLYLCLLDIANSRHWPNQFAVKSSSLEESAGIEKKDTVYDARNKLRQIGLIDFTSKRGSKLVHYSILGVDNALITLGIISKSSEQVPEKKPKKRDNLPGTCSELDPNLPGTCSELDPCSLTDASDSGIVKRNVKETKQINNKTPLTDAKNPSVKVLIDYYHDSFLKKFGEKPVISGAKDGNLLKKLLADYPEDKIKSWLDAFFSSKDTFITGSSYSLGVFYSQINKFLADKATKKTAGGGKYAGIVHKNG